MTAEILYQMYSHFFFMTFGTHPTPWGTLESFEINGEKFQPGFDGAQLTDDEKKVWFYLAEWITQTWTEGAS